MADIVIRAGDRLPTLVRTLEVGGAVVDLTTATAVTFVVSGSTGTVITGPCTITDALNGIVSYAWSANDALVPAGFYAAKYVATFPGGTLTVPDDGYLVLEITSVSQGVWTYSGNPSSSLRDAVRFHLGDTNEADQLLADAELDYLITDWALTTTRPRLLAAEAAEVLANRAAREVTVNGDGVTANLQEQIANFRALATALRFQDGQRNLAGPDLNVDAETWDDPSIRPFSFAIGMNDNTRVGPADYSNEIDGDADAGGYW